MISRNNLIRLIYSLAIILSIATATGIIMLLESKSHIFVNSFKAPQAESLIEPFPVGVNPIAKTITPSPVADSYFYNTIASASDSRDNWWNQVASVFASKNWYQNLASPVSRIIVIWPGERKEEISNNIAKILKWDNEQVVEFKRIVDASDPILSEGKYYPGQYVAHVGATPEDIKNVINESFESEVLTRYTEEVALQVPLEDALIIASLLEREASDFNNMREISGVIWNRIFIDMPLQLDATLQYAKGSNKYEPRWWPIVKSKDKFIESPFNTYKYKGLPPAPIANPSAESILAALNPIVTECLFYFHTSDKAYHCSKDYEEHVAKLKTIYGRGS
ncbi:endolytic transglycosylase MltG [Candidatus Kaiserbacteria bacterium]|nr:endolytic transglycosylase MltG [Candidatus Kaiserbacteria bacterium]